MHKSWLDPRGPAAAGGYITSPVPSTPERQAAGLSPNEHRPSAQQSNRQLRKPLGSFGDCDRMTKVERIFSDSNLVSLITLYTYIRLDEQCITQKYKGKILVLHYTFLKIYTE